MLPSKDKYTYCENEPGTWTICAPTDMSAIKSTGINLSSELLAADVCEELNAAIEFGKKEKLPQAYVPGWTGDDDVYIK